MLGIGSALYKTPLKRRFGTLGVNQADSSHIPQPAIAGLGFAPNGVNAFSSPQNFDSPFGLPQDDTLTLETLWLFVTLSKRGSYLLRLHTAIHLRARRSFAF